jgi:DNA-binding MarR family transcriptional regulator
MGMCAAQHLRCSAFALIICAAQIFTETGAHVKMDNRQRGERVIRSLRRVNFQGSIFGQSVAIRLGLSESDVDALELLLDTGTATAGKLSELMGLTTGAVTRVVDRLEQAGYVRRTVDPADRRKVVIEVVPERVAGVESLLESLERAAIAEVDRYTAEQLDVINGFLTRMAELTQAESSRLRTQPEVDPAEPIGAAEYSAPLAGISEARLSFRAGTQELRIRPGKVPTELFRGRFEGPAPQVRVRDGRVHVQYRGMGFDWRKRTATVAINPSIPWRVEIFGGLQRLEADLRDVDLRGLTLTGGTERIQLELGRAHDEIPLQITGGGGTIRVERPTGVPVRLRLTGGTGHLELDGATLGAKGGESTIESRGWAATGDRYALEITGGSKSITLVERPDLAG